MKRVIFCLAWAAFAFADSAKEEALTIEQVAEELGPSVQEFYSYMQEAVDDEDWWSAIDYGEIVRYHFPESPFSQEIPFQIGRAYYRLHQYELANESLSEYLKVGEHEELRRGDRDEVFHRRVLSPRRQEAPLRLAQAAGVFTRQRRSPEDLR